MKACIQFAKFAATGLLLGAGTILGQDPVAVPGQPSSLLIGGPSPIGTERALERAGSSFRGGGVRYDVEFAGGRMTFTPALGSNARDVHPLQFALESIRRGSTTILEADGSPHVSADGYVVSQRRGAITERFDVRGEGVELSYVFPTRIGGAGDLVVRGRLTTDLTTEHRGETRGPIRLTAEGIGGVEIGRVTGIDAVGRTEPGSMRFDGTHLELVLPSMFVDTAAYPLVLDPLIGTSFNAGSDLNDDDQADVAYTNLSNEYLVVWRRTFTGADTRIRAQRINGTTGAKIGGFLSITGGNSNSKPAVAAVATTNRFLVVWQSGPSPFGPFDINCRAVNGGSGALSAIVPVAAGVTNEHSPDVGGERVSDNEAVVVWVDDSVGVFGAQVNVGAGSGDPFVLGFPVTIRATSGTVRAPAISKSGGTFGRYAVVWQELGTSQAIPGQCIDRNLNLIGGLLSVATDTTIAEESADVDGDGANFVCVWGETESGLTGDQDVYCRRIECNASFATLPGLKLAVESDPSDDERDPAVAFLGPKYVVTWTDENGPFLDTDVYGVSLDPDDCDRCGFEFTLIAGSNREESSSIGSKWAGGSNSDDGLLIATTYDVTSSSFFGDIVAQQFSATGAGGAVVDTGGGCGLGGTASIAGTYALSNTVNVNLTGTAGSICALHIGTPGGSFACGPCQVTTPFLAIPVAVVGGDATFPLELACSGLIYVGADWEYQYVSGFTGTMPCPFAPTVSFSNRVVATFGL